LARASLAVASRTLALGVGALRAATAALLQLVLLAR
jgi:hypothetical protein